MSTISLYCPDCKVTLGPEHGTKAMKTGECPVCGTDVEVQT